MVFEKAINDVDWSFLDYVFYRKVFGLEGAYLLLILSVIVNGKASNGFKVSRTLWRR